MTIQVTMTQTLGYTTAVQGDVLRPESVSHRWKSHCQKMHSGKNLDFV